MKVTGAIRQYCVTVLQCYSSKINCGESKINSIFIYINIEVFLGGLTNLFENCNTVTRIRHRKKKFEIIIFFAKTFENRNAAAVPLQRQSERRKFALLQEKNYGPTREQKFQSKCDTRES